MYVQICIKYQLPCSPYQPHDIEPRVIRRALHTRSVLALQPGILLCRFSASNSRCMSARLGGIEFIDMEIKQIHRFGLTLIKSLCSKAHGMCHRMPKWWKSVGRSEGTHSQLYRRPSNGGQILLVYQAISIVRCVFRVATRICWRIPEKSRNKNRLIFLVLAPSVERCPSLSQCVCRCPIRRR